MNTFENLKNNTVLELEVNEPVSELPKMEEGKNKKTAIDKTTIYELN